MNGAVAVTTVKAICEPEKIKSKAKKRRCLSA